MLAVARIAHEPLMSAVSDLARMGSGTRTVSGGLCWSSGAIYLFWRSGMILASKIIGLCIESSQRSETVGDSLTDPRGIQERQIERLFFEPPDHACHRLTIGIKTMGTNRRT